MYGVYSLEEAQANLVQFSTDFEERPPRPLIDPAKGKLSKNQLEEGRKRRLKARITVEHTDIIQNEFWDIRPWLINDLMWQQQI